MRLFILAILLIGCQSVTESPLVLTRYESFGDRFMVEAGSVYPDSLGLPYPNPFNAALGDTALRVVFALKDSADVRLLLQNVIGDSVVVFRSERLAPGLYSGTVPMTNPAGDALRAGLYFITLRADPDKRNYINSRLVSVEASK
jgi:hypothetical protein